MIESGTLSLRRLAALFNKEHLEQVYRLNSVRVSKNTGVYFLSALDLLVSLFGGFEQLQRAINQTSFNLRKEILTPRWIGNLLMLYDYLNLDFTSRPKTTNTEFGVNYSVTLGKTYAGGDVIFGEVSEAENIYRLNLTQFKKLFIGALDNYKLIRKQAIKE